MHDKAKESVPKYKPNVVLLNAGTNDVVQDRDLNNTGVRMEEMLRDIYNSVPNAVVVLSTLIPNRDKGNEVALINQQYRELIAKLQHEGLHIHLAEMDDGFITLNEIYNDGIHPTVEGARRMASVWLRAIQEVEAQSDWLQKPDDIDGMPDDSNNQCPKTWKSGSDDPRSGWQILMALSANIKDDGTYVHSSNEVGTIGQISRFVDPFEQRTRIYSVHLINPVGGLRGRDVLVEVGGQPDLDAGLVTVYPDLASKKTRDGSYYVDVDSDCYSRGKHWNQPPPPPFLRFNEVQIQVADVQTKVLDGEIWYGPPYLRVVLWPTDAYLTEQ